jgi:hypothetical protein
MYVYYLITNGVRTSLSWLHFFHFTFRTSLFALHFSHFTFATSLLPLHFCHFTFATSLLPLHFCHFTFATSLLPLHFCHFTFAASLLPLHFCYFTFCTSLFAVDPKFLDPFWSPSIDKNIKSGHRFCLLHSTHSRFLVQALRSTPCVTRYVFCPS